MRLAWSSFASVFQKELIHIRRDRSTLGLAVMLPLFQLILFGFIDLTVHDLPTVVVDQSRTTESRLLMDQLRASKTFRIDRVMQDASAARDEIIAGRARIAVVVPPDFAQRKLGGQTADVLVLIDGSESNAGAQALASVNGLFAAKNGPRATYAAHPIIMFNPAGRTANYIIPGLVAVLLQLVAVVLSSMSIVRERERGTLEQLLVTPIRPLGLVLGKLLPYLLLGIVEAALIIAIMRFGFRVPINGSLAFLFATALVYTFSLLALGLFISTIAQTQSAALQLGQLLLLPSIFLSGYIFPAEGLPTVLRVAGQFMPATHMIAIMRGVVLRGAAPAQLTSHVLVLLLMSIVLVAVSTRRFKKVSL